MASELNHVIIHCKDRRETGRFVADLLGTEPPVEFGPFTQLSTSNSVGIDFADHIIGADALNLAHIAFLITEDEFDATYARITERSLTHWADPGRTTLGINHYDGGRGVYVMDPGGTVAVEFLTKPYGNPAK
ncbi:hypothetical protein FHS39_000822 [Streptomyces olivoverticillatus]|uniref:VOC domain-containing protein n=1 Tax=Streptomyces olivoverticillatus TaxID=66427 RepID=A0A7W7LKC7_9ACTN|nr:VOC family protein [Streptomyces olivoverticillatus]MBB4891822.1 hypothetical protein [Streptomyces olivoverticillatus]